SSVDCLLKRRLSSPNLAPSSLRFLITQTMTDFGLRHGRWSSQPVTHESGTGATPMIDDIARNGHCCIFCWDPWFSHFGKKRECMESAWVIVSGRQTRES